MLHAQSNLGASSSHIKYVQISSFHERLTIRFRAFHSLRTIERRQWIYANLNLQFLSINITSYHMEYILNNCLWAGHDLTWLFQFRPHSKIPGMKKEKGIQLSEHSIFDTQRDANDDKNDKVSQDQLPVWRYEERQQCVGYHLDFMRRAHEDEWGQEEIHHWVVGYQHQNP